MQSSKKIQLTVSKALEKYSFKITRLHLQLCTLCTTSLEMNILSKLIPFLMKPVWYSEMIWCITGLNLFASTFVKIFIMKMMRLIGLKSLASLGVEILGTSVMKDEFNTFQDIRLSLKNLVPEGSYKYCNI